MIWLMQETKICCSMKLDTHRNMNDLLFLEWRRRKNTAPEINRIRL